MPTTKSNPSNVVVVDGSNIATEGRSLPSLSQLNDAVMAFREEYPDAVITVVVDATFGHRIDKKEAAEFDAGVAHNELVAPPAGAIGRGDAFVLSIANKVGARILSNDSFQEFHGDYPWLFDEGRLIGGKPVPYVGWVFVERLPVKGPVSRKSQRAARSGGRSSEPKTVRRQASKEASLPMPVPTAPPPSARRAVAQPEVAAASAAKAGAAVNDVLPFLEFVERHPVGSSVNGVVESYASHGAYVSIGDVRGYVPLRLMGDPPPRSARATMKIGDAVTLVVTNFAPRTAQRRPRRAPRRADRRGPADPRARRARRGGRPGPPYIEASGQEGGRRAGGSHQADQEGSRSARRAGTGGGGAAGPAGQAGGPQGGGQGGGAPAKKKAAAAKKAPAKRATKKVAAPEPSTDGDEAPATKRASRKRTAKAVPA